MIRQATGRAGASGLIADERRAMFTPQVHGTNPIRHFEVAEGRLKNAPRLPLVARVRSRERAGEPCKLTGYF